MNCDNFQWLNEPWFCATRIVVDSWAGESVCDIPANLIAGRRSALTYKLARHDPQHNLLSYHFPRILDCRIKPPWILFVIFMIESLRNISSKERYGSCKLCVMNLSFFPQVEYGYWVYSFRWLWYRSVPLLPRWGNLPWINNYSPKAKWLSVNIHRDEVEVNIHR